MWGKTKRSDKLRCRDKEDGTLILFLFHQNLIHMQQVGDIPKNLYPPIIFYFFSFASGSTFRIVFFNYLQCSYWNPVCHSNYATQKVVALTEVQFEAGPFICRFRVKTLTLNSDDYRCAISEKYFSVTSC